ncbi:uncharacterized protein G2W53_042803 [Senna tora]|uniref:Uncharacterized protein n=1 Tax=Senna tora TaxID=362788 RepID=A0A834VZS6_9FABA|nr:uncharacterized protein G2W53_042803 [Senna tora]
MDQRVGPTRIPDHGRDFHLVNEVKGLVNLMSFMEIN